MKRLVVMTAIITIVLGVGAAGQDCTMLGGEGGLGVVREPGEKNVVIRKSDSEAPWFAVWGKSSLTAFSADTTRGRVRTSVVLPVGLDTYEAEVHILDHDSDGVSDGLAFYSRDGPTFSLCGGLDGPWPLDYSTMCRVVPEFVPSWNRGSSFFYAYVAKGKVANTRLGSYAMFCDFPPGTVEVCTLYFLPPPGDGSVLPGAPIRMGSIGGWTPDSGRTTPLFVRVVADVTGSGLPCVVTQESVWVPVADGSGSPSGISGFVAEPLPDPEILTTDAVIHVIDNGMNGLPLLLVTGVSRFTVSSHAFFRSGGVGGTPPGSGQWSMMTTLAPYGGREENIAQVLDVVESVSSSSTTWARIGMALDYVVTNVTTAAFPLTLDMGQPVFSQPGSDAALLESALDGSALWIVNGTGLLVLVDAATGAGSVASANLGIRGPGFGTMGSSSSPVLGTVIDAAGSAKLTVVGLDGAGGVSFAATDVLSFSCRPSYVVWADVTGDGVTDVVAQSCSNTRGVSVAIGQSGLSFGPLTLAGTLPSVVGSPVFSSAVTFAGSRGAGGDGREDVVITEVTSSGTSVSSTLLLNVGTASGAVNIVDYEPSYREVGPFGALFVGDLTGDGVEEVVVRKYSSSDEFELRVIFQSIGMTLVELSNDGAVVRICSSRVGGNISLHVLYKHGGAGMVPRMDLITFVDIVEGPRIGTFRMLPIRTFPLFDAVHDIAPRVGGGLLISINGSVVPLDFTDVTLFPGFIDDDYFHHSDPDYYLPWAQSTLVLGRAFWTREGKTYFDAAVLGSLSFISGLRDPIPHVLRIEVQPGSSERICPYAPGTRWPKGGNASSTIIALGVFFAIVVVVLIIVAIVYGVRKSKRQQQSKKKKTGRRKTGSRKTGSRKTGSRKTGSRKKTSEGGSRKKRSSSTKTGRSTKTGSRRKKVRSQLRPRPRSRGKSTERSRKHMATTESDAESAATDRYVYDDYYSNRV